MTATIKSTFPLAQVPVGQTSSIVSVDDSACICQLRSLGLVEGAAVQLIREVSGGRLLVLRVDGADVALRREVAATIHVRPEDDHVG